MRNQRLEQLVLDSKDDNQKMNDLLEAYKPFIASCTQKTSGKYLKYGSDDELSIAMMAFVLAVKKYKPEYGDFLNFSKTVIRSKVIDYYRSQKKHTRKLIYLKQNSDEQEEQDKLEAQASMIVYSEEKTREDRVLEIQTLKDKLNCYDINFIELENVAPKNKQTKKVCRDVILYIVNNPAVLNEVLYNKNLPLAQIEKVLGIRRKKFERHRKYIITVLIIKTGDYPYLAEYVKDL